MNSPNSPYIGKSFGGIAERLSWMVRQRIFKSLSQFVNPSEKTSVLDVGVTSDRRMDSNFFEKLYPYPHRITAAGLEDASFLETDFPGVKFLRLEKGKKLPFPDKSFDLVVSFAVIEHVGNREAQKFFVDELCRVGSIICITTPNRWFPVEFHTTLPLVHWLPVNIFRILLRSIGQLFWAEEENLNLLDRVELISLFPPDIEITELHQRLVCLVSNLVFILIPLNRCVSKSQDS